MTRDRSATLLHYQEIYIYIVKLHLESESKLFEVLKRELWLVEILL